MAATAGRWVEVDRDTPHKKGDSFRIEMRIHAPYNEFNAGLLKNAFKAQSFLLQQVTINKFVYGEGENGSPWRFIMYCTAKKDIG